MTPPPTTAPRSTRRAGTAIGRRRGTALLVLGLALVSCGRGDGGDTPPATAPTTAPQRAGGEDAAPAATGTTSGTAPPATGTSTSSSSTTSASSSSTTSSTAAEHHDLFGGRQPRQPAVLRRVPHRAHRALVIDPPPRSERPDADGARLQQAKAFFAGLVPTAPAAIRADWDQLNQVVQAANTIDDVNSAATGATKDATDRIEAWSKANCGFDPSQVLTTTGRTGERVSGRLGASPPAAGGGRPDQAVLSGPPASSAARAAASRAIGTRKGEHDT
ncbi:MAG: hypothetical protein R2726_00940 [Acidimicrobiales bacterium]